MTSENSDPTPTPQRFRRQKSLGWGVLGVTALVILGGSILTRAYGVPILLLTLAMPVLISTAFAAPKNPDQGAPVDSPAARGLGCFGTGLLVCLALFLVFGISCAIILKNMGPFR